MNFDLSRMQRLMSVLGNPHDRFSSVHVAGTNGKGSVCAMLSSILRASGLKVGLYTSPHLVDVRERFQIDGRLISSEQFQALKKRVLMASRRREVAVDGLTEFELLTAIALLWFAQQKIDVAVLEVGLGGRLDATNVVRRTWVSVITNIAFDHMEYLGNTLPEIAAEKAGIIKWGVPVVTGTTGEALKVIRRVGAERRAEVLTPLSLQTFARSYRSHVPLFGSHQALNARVALRAVEVIRRSVKISNSAILSGLKATRWPGRFEILQIPLKSAQRTVILDGAHNPAAMEALRVALAEAKFKSVDLIFGALKDKDFRTMVKVIEPVVARCWTVPVSSSRTSDSKSLAGLAEWKSKAEASSSLESAWKLALQQKPERPLLITGSLYLVGAARKKILKYLKD